VTLDSTVQCQQLLQGGMSSGAEREADSTIPDFYLSKFWVVVSCFLWIRPDVSGASRGFAGAGSINMGSSSMQDKCHHSKLLSLVTDSSDGTCIMMELCFLLRNVFADVLAVLNARSCVICFIYW